MITEERLKELNKDNQTIYYALPSGELFELYCCDYVIYPDAIKTHSGVLSGVLLDFENLYETKEEAEFVAKYHCSKVIKFEPPTFEEFMKIDKEWKKWEFSDGHYYIIHNQLLNRMFVGELDYGSKEFYFKNEKEMEQAYYQAVEYAKKLFLGEQE